MGEGRHGARGKGARVIAPAASRARFVAPAGAPAAMLPGAAAVWEAPA